MTALLRALAGLPQSQGGLSGSVFGDPRRGGFWLVRLDGDPEAAVAIAANAARFGEVAGQETKGYARLLSGAPAIKWLAGFTSAVRLVLGAMVGPLASGGLP